MTTLIRCLPPLVFLAACSAPHRLDPSEPHLLHREFVAMGTKISVTLVADDAEHERRGPQALDAVQAAMREFGQRWWAWGDGDLAKINRALAAKRPAEIPEAMRPLFSRAWQLSLASERRFEPRIGALVRLWGFDDVTRSPTAPPARADVAQALAALNAAPAYDGGARYGPAPKVAWDFGAIAKGWAVDAALDQLRSAGFGDALVNAGGNLAVRGSPGPRPWHVAIRDPRTSAENPAFLAELDARDESINTHADDQRFFEAGGRRYGHILDPRTGQPARGLRSVTVVHADGALADAGGLAMFVSGPRHWRSMARKLGLEQVLVIDDEGRAFATPVFAQRLRMNPALALKVIR